MVHSSPLNITIKTKAGTPLFDGEQVATFDFDEVIILEEGMQSGLPAVYFVLTGPNGERMVVETTGRLVNMLATACKGVAARTGRTLD